MIYTLIFCMVLADPVFSQQQRSKYVIACDKTCHNMLCNKKSCSEISNVGQKMIGYQPRLALADRPAQECNSRQSHYRGIVAAYNATHDRCPLRQNRRSQNKF